MTDTATLEPETKPADHGPAASKFLTGRCSFQRFRASSRREHFGERHLERLAEFKAGRSRIASADGIETGWAGGGHVLDTTFGLAKNIIDDCLVFDLRIDTDKPPAELLKAYTAIELAALSKDNPSGFASKRQKRAAKEAARERLEQEGKDGRFRKRKCIPCLWDERTSEILFGSASHNDAGKFFSLFQETFGQQLRPISAGVIATAFGDFADCRPSEFVPGTSPEDVAWIPFEKCLDWLGNEFLLWLWHHLDVEGDSLRTADGDATAMIARSLLLECPRGATGTDVIRHEMPNRLPEAKRAIRSGKLPRKAGLVLVRHGEQFEFTIQAETFALAGVKLPDVGDDVVEPRARQEARVEQLRGLIETVDGLFKAFLDRRQGPGWRDWLKKIQRWLESE